MCSLATAGAAVGSLGWSSGVAAAHCWATAHLQALVAVVTCWGAGSPRTSVITRRQNQTRTTNKICCCYLMLSLMRGSARHDQSVLISLLIKLMNDVRCCPDGARF